MMNHLFALASPAGSVVGGEVWLRVTSTHLLFYVIFVIIIIVALITIIFTVITIIITIIITITVNTCSSALLSASRW